MHDAGMRSTRLEYIPSTGGTVWRADCFVTSSKPREPMERRTSSSTRGRSMTSLAPRSSDSASWRRMCGSNDERTFMVNTMKLDHVAIWAVDIERMRTFYETYFDARSNVRYENARKRFASYFLTFPGGGRLELMHRPDIQPIPDSPGSRE